MPATPSKPAAATATMVAVGLCGLAVRPEGQRGFVALSPPAAGIATGIPAVSAPIGAGARVSAAATEAPSSVSKAAVAAAAACALAGGLAASRKRERRNGSLVTRHARYFRPNSKGMKPLIHRKIARPYMKEYMKQIGGQYKTQDDMETLMKKTMYGNMKFNFTSPHFVDAIPWVGPGADQASQRKTTNVDHLYDDPFYVRKFLEPAKFKKLEIVNWDMPESFTKTVTMQELVQVGMQYGHASCHWNQKMVKYIYSSMDNTHIFDLVQTAAQMNRACYYVMEAASKGAKFFITGTKEQAGPIVKEHAMRCGANYTDIRFAGGLLTNRNQVLKGIKLLKRLLREAAQGAWVTESQDQIEKNRMAIDRLTRKYSGCKDMEGLPDIMIVVDPVKERAAVAECARIGIPVIALCDSNANPTFVDICVPGNASGSKSIELFLSKIAEAINLGRALGNSTAPGDREEVKPEWDPWVFSMDRNRAMRRRSKRQPWMREQYGSYEQWKEANPWGRIPSVMEFRKFSWTE